MCGICGFCGPLDSTTISYMTNTLRLRGPDDNGSSIFQEDQVALGHCRLSILDLTEAGHQPMFSHDRKLCITYNGEIYNFIELRKDLEKHNVKFKSQSDTEVILACYEKYGLSMVPRLDGIFAFTIYDAKNRLLHLVRDHVGVKPLYYTLSKGSFIFGSEIKAILASNNVDPEINYQALWDYLTYLYIPCPLTMYAGIFQVPPAHILTFDLSTKLISLQCYWDPLDKKIILLSDFNEITHLLQHEMSETVKQQLISDVPVGALLSGGIDSTVIVGLMSRHSSEKVRTFTAIFSDKKASYFNEREEAARVARKFGTVHEELEILTPTLEDIISMINWTDQPFGNPTLFLSYLICKKIKENVTVALSGAGGDELFGGYIRYKHFSLARKIIDVLPSNIKYLTSPLLKVWPSNTRPELRRRVYKFFLGLVPDQAQQYLSWTYFLDEKAKSELLPSARNCLPSKRILDNLFKDKGFFHDALSMLQYVDINSYLRDDILEYTDKSSMATSLEVRVPFLSPKIIELSFRIPGKFKIANGRTKISLTEAFKEIIPEENLKRPKKGFTAPMKIWAADMDKYFDQIETVLPAECPLDLNAVRQLRKEHRLGQMDHGQILFGILMLEVWMAKYIYNKK